MPLRTRLLIAALVATCWLAPSRAEAKFFLVTYGDSIKHLAEVPETSRQALHQATGQDVQIGYAYSYFGMFWIDLWTWGGKYCLYKDKTFWNLEPAQAASLLAVPEEGLPRPFTYSYPPGLVIIGLIGLVFLYFYLQVKRDERRAEALLADVRYARALEIVKSTGQDAAVLHLVDQGIGEKQAKEAVELFARVWTRLEPAAPPAAAEPAPAAATPPASTAIEPATGTDDVPKT